MSASARSMATLGVLVGALVCSACGSAHATQGGGSTLPLAPLSSLGALKPAPAPGHAGPEGVSIPAATKILAEPKAVHLGEDVDGVRCQRVEKIAYHVHAHLTIFVDGLALAVPYGIGIGPPLSGVNTVDGPFVTGGNCFMWLHTHALDGVIHIESPTERVYTLGQFFAVWGIPLSTTRVGPARGKVTTFYDGRVWTGNPAAVPLGSRTQVQLDVGTPLVAPEHIVFPPGLAAAMQRPTTTTK